MKCTLIAALLVAGLLPGTVFCEEEESKAKPTSDPTAPSPKIEETLVKIRRVEELDKVIKDVARLADEIDRLKQASAKDVASLAKEIDGVNQANTALSEKLDVQSKDLNKQITTEAAKLEKRISDEAKRVQAADAALSEKFDQQASSFDKRFAELNAHLEKQQQLLDNLQKTMVTQAVQQNEIVEALKTQFDDLETRLTNVPPVSLQGFVTGDDQRGAAILDLGGSKRVVREGDTIHLQPQGNDSVIRTIHVKKIADGTVLLEIGPWDQTLLVQ